MMDMHPIDLLFSSLTSIAQRGDEGYAPSEHDCSLCKRSASEYGNQSIELQNSYKENQNLCPACHSFFISNPDILGVEKASAPTTSQKFGMWGGVGCLVEQKTGRAILFAPPGVIAKLPDVFFKAVNVIETVSTKQVLWLMEHQESLSFPLLWINDFGRKTQFLIEGLQLSHSINDMHPCADAELNSATSPSRALDLGVVGKIVSDLSGHAQKNAFVKTIRDLAYGRISPLDAGAFFKENPDLKSSLSAMPIDPHVRLKMLTVVTKLL
jgi:hypothetical protein